MTTAPSILQALRSAFLVPLSTAVFAMLACSPTPKADHPTSSGGGAAASPATDMLRIATVNYPLSWMAERLAPEAAVSFPAPSNVDPAHWQPDAQTIATVYQTADLIVLNGAGYAGWTALATLPEEAMVDTSVTIQDRLLTRPGAQTHSHGPEGEHTHQETAFTTWLDPRLAKEQARTLAAAITALATASDAEVSRNLASLESDLDELDERLERVFARLEGEPLVMSHPVYAYLEHRYGLDARSMHWEPQTDLGEKDLHDLEHLLKTHEAHWVVWESEPTAATREALRARGLQSLVFETAAARPQAGDFLSVMKANANALEAAFIQ